MYLWKEKKNSECLVGNLLGIYLLVSKALLIESIVYVFHKNMQVNHVSWEQTVSASYNRKTSNTLGFNR